MAVPQLGQPVHCESMQPYVTTALFTTTTTQGEMLHWRVWLWQLPQKDADTAVMPLVLMPLLVYE